jgi:hypothetical protein
MATQRFRLALAVSFFLAATGCAATSIGEVLANPDRYRNQTITVRGTVDESASVLGRGAYHIRDGSQGLWVVTGGGTPQKGARVDVTGRLEQAYDLASLGQILKLPSALGSPLVLIESSHRAR